MSTTRHLINRQRRLAAASTASAEAPERAASRTAAGVRDRAPAGRTPARTPTRDPNRAPARPAARAADRPDPGGAADGGQAAALLRRAGGLLRLPAVLTALLAASTVLLGAFAAVAAHKAADLHDSVATGNTALTDAAATAQVKSAVTTAVNAVFSYDYADPVRTDTAARKDLTGKAVQQYATLIAPVRAQAPEQKLVLTTTVTQTGVEAVDGDRARVLVFADQRNTSTAGSGRTSYAAAMFAVDAVRRDGGWLIASIDTFG